MAGFSKLSVVFYATVDCLSDYLVFPTGGVAGLPLHRVVAHLRRLLVLGHGVVSPGDTDRVRGQSHGLHPHRGNHGSAGVWHGSGVFIKKMEKVILRWVYGVWEVAVSRVCGKLMKSHDAPMYDNECLHEKWVAFLSIFSPRVKRTKWIKKNK